MLYERQCTQPSRCHDYDDDDDGDGGGDGNDVIVSNDGGAQLW